MNDLPQHSNKAHNVHTASSMSSLDTSFIDTAECKIFERSLHGSERFTEEQEHTANKNEAPDGDDIDGNDLIP